MSKEIFTELFSYYNVNNRSDKTKRAMRKVIKERLSKAYPGKTWSDLTELEQRRFKLVTMKDYLIKKTPDLKRDVICQKIDSEISDTLLEVNEEIEEHNKYMDILFRQFYDNTATEEQNRNSYDEFCYYLSKYFPYEKPQSFEEWKNRPLRLYDIQQSIIHEINIQTREESEADDYTTPVTQAEIDHVTLKCLVKVIEEKLNVTIDTDSIHHCLEVTRNIDQFENEWIQNEIDTDSSVPIEKQKSIIRSNRATIDANRKLKALDFITKKKGN